MGKKAGKFDLEEQRHLLTGSLRACQSLTLHFIDHYWAVCHLLGVSLLGKGIYLSNIVNNLQL